MAGKREKTRESILNASYELFAKKGFKQVTMKDICDVTGMSRGGLYSHFPGTRELFEALLEEIADKDETDFHENIKNGTPAKLILTDAFERMEKEMLDQEDSLSIAMYEYAQTSDSDVMERLHKKSIRKWKELIRYGIKNGEFQNVDVDEIVDLILFSYQGVRMWSRIVPVKPKTSRSVLKNIRKQLTGE